MSPSSLTRRLRWFIIASVLFLVCWQIATLVDAPRETTIALAIYGFVFHMIFGKAYALVPAYFDRELRFPTVPVIQLPCTVLGAICLACAPLLSVASLRVLGAFLWGCGVALFLFTLGWTIRDNLGGRETGTSTAKASHRPVDRIANVFIPVAMVYLAVGSYELFASVTSVPPVFDGLPAQSTHLLAAGTATILVFAIGFRLLPRFLVAVPSRPLVITVLVTGAIGPVLIASGVGGHPFRLRIGAIFQTVAIFGFTGGYVHMFLRSDRRRIGSYGVLAGALFGIVGVVLGLSFAFDTLHVALIEAHIRLNILGFLGLTIIGVAYYFYPPSAGSVRASGNITAIASIGFIVGGLLFEALGLLISLDTLVLVGRVGTLLGTVAYAHVLLGLFWERR